VAVLITLNISTDFYLMSIPLPVSTRTIITIIIPSLKSADTSKMIWKSRLQAKKKWALSIMFSSGLLVMIFGLLRCILILKVSPSPTILPPKLHHPPTLTPPPSQSGANGAEQAGEWSIRESFVAVLVNNMPMLYSLFQYLTRRTSAPASHSHSYKLASWRSGESSNKRSKRFRHPLSVPNDTVNGSDEHIVQYPPSSLPGGGFGGAEYKGAAAEAYSTPSITRQGSRYGKGGEEGKGIQVRTELSVQSSEMEKEGGEKGFALHRPPPGYVRSHA
jgi:hypothetical protein